MAAPVFSYSMNDFIPEIPLEAECRDQHSKFDKQLQEKWDEALDKGYFRYRLGLLPTRVVEGPHGFVAQLNVKRATERRKPQEIKSTKQLFNDQEFNFNKIRPHEIIMEMHPGSEDNLSTPVLNGTSHAANGSHSEEGGCIDEEGRGSFKVIINISPLEHCNVLLVPSPEKCQPQIATMEMIQIGVEAIMLSSSRGFRIGYNSLCAYASVNHLHMHAYYAQHRLPAEYWPSKEVVRGRCDELIGWPAQALILQARQENYKEIVRDLYLIVKLLQDKDIAHNMFFTRGLTLGPNPKDDGKTIRLILWPRRSSYGTKASDAFNGACCELGGHLPIKLEKRYKHLIDEECCQVLESDSLLPQDFADLKKDVKNLFQQWNK